MDFSSFEAILHSFSQIPESDSRSKIGPKDFVVALVTAVAMSEKFRSIAALRRYFISALGVEVERSSFWERLSTTRLTKFLSKVVTSLASVEAGRIISGTKIIDKLGIKGICLLDSSSITVPKGAAKDFPAPRNNVVPAATKWHFCVGLFGQVTDWFCITDATTHDRKVFPPLEMLKGCLIIFDLGYWDYQLLLDLSSQGCFFLSRVKDGSRIIIRGLPDKQQWKQPLGKYLNSVTWNKFRGEVFEILGEMKTVAGEEFQLRVIGFWNPSTRCYHWYATNLAVDAKIIYPLYRIRWQIELQFKAAKSSLHLADMPSANSTIIINLLLSSIISCLLSNICGRSTLGNATNEIKLSFSLQRAAKVFTYYAEELREWLLKMTDSFFSKLTEKIQKFLRELVDPNYKRRPNAMNILELSL